MISFVTLALLSSVLQPTPNVGPLPAPLPNQGAQTGGGEDPAPVFRFAPHANAAGGSGPANLTVDAFALTTVVECDARTATVTDWPCATGGTWTESDGDVTPGLSSPFTESGSRASDYDRFRAHRAPNTSLGEVDASTSFSAIITAFLTDRGATQYVLSKYDTATSEGWALRVSSGGVLQGVINGTAFGSFQLDSFGFWVNAELTCSSTMCYLTANGVERGSVARSGTLATVTNPKNLSVGCRPNGTNQDCIDGKVAYLRVQTGGTSSVVNGSVAAVNLRHAMELEGTWPIAAVDPVPILRARASAKYCDVIRDASGQYEATRFWHRVGPDWMCIHRDREASADGFTVVDGRTESSYFAEPGGTNLITYSEDFSNGAWSDLTGADYVTALSGANGPTEIDQHGFWYYTAQDLVGVEHGMRHAGTTLTAAPYNASALVAWARGEASPATYFWIRDNTIGATAIAWFDLRTCQQTSAGAGLRSMGANINRSVGTNPRITEFGHYSNGYYHWCRPEIVVTGTAAAHDFDFGWSEADGVTTMQTSAAERVGVIANFQVTLMDRAGDRALSYIPSGASPGTAAPDTLRFSYLNVPAAGGMQVVSVMLPDQRISNGIEDYATARVSSTTPCWIERNVDNSIGFEQTGEADTAYYGLSWTIVTAGVQQWTFPTQAFQNGRHSWRDGRMHSARLVFFPNDARSYIDGSLVANRTHTSVTLPDLSGASVLPGGSGITLGYTAAFSDEWARGGLHECAIYAEEWIAPVP